MPPSPTIGCRVALERALPGDFEQICRILGGMNLEPGWCRDELTKLAHIAAYLGMGGPAEQARIERVNMAGRPALMLTAPRYDGWGSVVLAGGEDVASSPRVLPDDRRPTTALADVACDGAVGLSVWCAGAHRRGMDSPGAVAGRSALVCARRLDTLQMRKLAGSVKKVGPSVLPASHFVGRDSELNLFRSLRQAAAAGRGAVVAISGDHGVGKTRLAREILADAERAGNVVLWAQGYDDEGSPAYWPWTELIQRYIDRFGLERARKVMGTGVRDIAGLIPALERLAPAVGSSGEPPSQQARYRLFAAMRSFVQQAAADSPLLLVLDDLHYCDPDTLRLFEAMAGDLESGRVLLIGTYVQRRALHHPVLPSVIATVSRLSWWREMTVGNLSEGDVRLLLEAEVGYKGSVALAPSVHRETEGNALLVVQAVRQIAIDAAAGNRHLKDDRWEEAASGNVAILITRRLARLSEPAFRTLQTAAVIGREVDSDLLAATIRTTPAQTRDMLAGALDDGLLVEIDPDHCRFAHELVQRAVAGSLAPAARCAIHRAAAEALETFRAAGRPVDPARIAWHFASAGIEHAAKAGHYARKAGEKAIETAAYDTALRHLEAAAAVAGLPQRERAELAMLRAWTLFALTRFFEVVPFLVEAFDLYAASGDIDRAVEAAAFDACPQGAESLPRESVRGLRERALALAPADSPQEARLLCALGESYSYAHPDRAEECFSRAMTLSRSLGDPHLEARILYARAWMEYRQLRRPAFLRTGAEALRLAREIGDRGVELLAGGRLANWKLFAATRRARRILPASCGRRRACGRASGLWSCSEPSAV